MKSKKETWERKMKNKKAMELEMLGWWIIALAILVLLIIGIVILRAKGVNALEYIKNLFRFRG